MIARRIGPAPLLGAVVVGIVAGEHAGPAPALGALVAAVLALVAAAGVAAGRRGVLALVCLCLAASLGAAAFTRRALDGLVATPVVAAAAHREGAIIDAELAGDPSAQRFSARAPARLRGIRLDGGGRIPSGGRTVLVDATGDAASRLGVLAAGDRVRLRGYFRPLGPFEARWRWRHAVAAFAAHDLVGFEGPRGSLLRVANALRGRVLAGHGRMPEPQRALVAGFLLGDTADLPGPVVADFRTAGLSHLVAVSGQNVAFVLALAGPLTRRGPRLLRLVAGSGVLVVFAAMTRWEPSVLRAAAMATCSMVSLAAGRPTAGLRALGLAGIGLLLADPFLLRSVAFQLSCAASAGIALFAPAVARRVPGPRWLRESVGVTVGAQVAVAPVMLAVFDGVPLISVPANVVAAPFAGPLTVLGLVGGVLGGVVRAPVLASVATLPAYLCASAVLAVARVAAAFPVMVRPDGASLLLAAGAIGIVAGGAGRATWRRAHARPPHDRLALPPR